MRISLIVAAAMAAVLTVPLTAADASAGPVRFSKVQYDGPGNDTGSNGSLNKEWIKVKNFSSKTKTLTGWTVRDPQGHVFKFPTFKLKAGKVVTIHTGDGTDTKSNLYWDSDGYVWNNSGDKAILKNKSKQKVDVCKWGNGNGTIAC